MRQGGRVPWARWRAQVGWLSRWACTSRDQFAYFCAVFNRRFDPLDLVRWTPNPYRLRSRWSPGLWREPRSDRTAEAIALCDSISQKRQKGPTLTLTDRPETLRGAGPVGPLVTAASPGQIARPKGMRFPLEKTKTNPKALTIGNMGSSFLPLWLDPSTRNS